VDINEAIIDLLSNALNVHVGETVPQSVSTDYVWIQRQGDILSEELNFPPRIDAVLFDVECVSLDIDASRTLTADAKETIRTCTPYSIEFEISGTHSQKIHVFDVEDHSDDYLAHSIQQDKDLHFGAFRVTAYLTDPFPTPEPVDDGD
jgi:hypothetical protein